MIKLVVISLFLHSSEFCLQVQDTIRVSGTVLNEEGWPVEYANIVFYDTQGHTIGGTISGTDGNFAFFCAKRLPFYAKMKISHINYNPFEMDSLTVSRNPVQLGEIKLKKKATELNPVEIKAYRPQYAEKGRSTVLNVTPDVLEKATTTTELFSLIPSVSVNPMEGIEVEGKSRILILIEGRRMEEGSPLRLLQPSQIRKIEIINTPSVKYAGENYDAILNIYLKPEKNTNLKGNLSGNIPNNKLNGYNANLAFNKDKLRMLANYDYYERDNGYSLMNRRIVQNDSIRQEGTIASYRDRTHTFVTACDYFLDDNTKINISARYGMEHYGLDQFADTYFNRAWSGNLNTINRYSSTTLNISGFLSHQIGQDKSLIAEVQYNYTNGRDNYFYKSLYTSDIMLMNKSLCDLSEKRFSGIFSYKMTLLHTIESEYGLKYNGISSDRDYQEVENNRKIGLHSQWVSSYVDLSGESGKLSYWGGIAVEFDHRTIDAVTKEYVHVYPNVGISYMFSHKINASLNCSRQVYRPDINQLDPYRYQGDTMNISYGNPSLKDYFENSYSLSWNYRSNRLFFKTSAGYRYTPGMITDYTYFNDKGVRFSTYQNAGNRQHFELNSSLSFSVSKILRVNASLLLYKQQLESVYGRSDVTSMDGSFYMSFYLPYSISISPYYRLKGKQAIPGGYYKPADYIYLYITRKMFHNHASLSVNFVQPAGDFRFKTYMNTESFNYTSSVVYNVRTVLFQFRYNFMTGKKNERTGREDIEWLEGGKEKGF